MKSRCLFLAQSKRDNGARECPLLGFRLKACLGRGRREDSQDYIRWYFADAAIAASFAVEFGGTLMKVTAG